MEVHVFSKTVTADMVQFSKTEIEYIRLEEHIGWDYWRASS